MNLYNEIDPYPAQWLRNLIAAGHIPAGVVDTRSIKDIDPDEIKNYTQCHFFAGIAGWSYALQLADWPANRPVWTGSCPCQPFSQAGKRKGVNDERHLWPAFFYLIQQCRPPIVFGEQVASADGLDWLDLVQIDLESAGYATWAADLCAAGVGAPHIRQRLYWAGYTESERCRETRETGARHPEWATDASTIGGLADSDMSARARQRQICISLESEQEASGCSVINYWAADAAVRCADGKSRPIEPSIQPLAHGVSNRVGRLRAYGNAIVPRLAAEFIKVMK